METYMDRLSAWRTALAFSSEEERQALEKIAADPSLAEESFHRFLEFGTAGMRGTIGLGTNRMNIYMVRRATQGFAKYLNAAGLAKQGVAIAYDSRLYSDVFAKEVALILAKNGVKAYLYSTLHSVPQLSYTVLKLHCAGGIVITASHNPPEYNGYKVYGQDGGQLASEDAESVTKYIDGIEDYLSILPMSEEAALEEGLLVYIGEDIDKLYYQDVLALIQDKTSLAKQASSLKVVYTPLFGSGARPVTHLLNSMGIDLYVVSAQTEPNPAFPGLSAPNPENKESFILATRLANEVGADLILATDPDCDRLGVAVRNDEGDFAILSGNQIGCLLLEYLLRIRRPDFLGGEFAVRSIASTPMADKIAAHYGVEMRTVLTGFKYIAEQIKLSLQNGEGRFIFGFEESYGFLGGTFVRDKDAAMASVLLTEAACSYKNQGIGLYTALKHLYETYGYYAEKVLSLTLSGIHGIEKIGRAVESLRTNMPEQIAGFPVTTVSDFLINRKKCITTGEISPLSLPKTNMLIFDFPDGQVIFRPSGTEPKLKAYLSYVASSKAEGDAILKKLFQWAMDELQSRTE